MQKELIWFTPKNLKEELIKGSWYLVMGTKIYDGRYVDVMYFWKWWGDNWYDTIDTFGTVIKAVARVQW